MLWCWWHKADRKGGCDGDGGMKLHTCCQNLEAEVQPTPQRTTGRLFSNWPRGRRPQKTLVKVAIIPIITWHSYPMHWWNRHGIPLMRHTYILRDVQWLCCGQSGRTCRSNKPQGASTTKDDTKDDIVIFSIIIFASSKHQLGHLDTNLSKYVQT